jgi:AcrR family transcriptional regulator
MTAPKRSRYHHGDLRAALISGAIELLDEQGARGFSMTEVTRRLGVVASAPYAHFVDRDALLAAVATHALELFGSQLLPAVEEADTPAERLATIATCYVEFAATNPALFRSVFQLALDKKKYPELASAERPIEQAFADCIGAASSNLSEAAQVSLAAAVESTIHGHAALLLDGRFGARRRRVRSAGQSAARSALAIVAGWDEAKFP